MMEISSDLVDWAQCELCKKWRKLPLGLNPNTLPEEWVCTMNTWDKAYSSCDAEEEVVGIPSESLHLGISDRKILYSDFQNRSLKGRKKNFSNCTNSNSITHAVNSKQTSNQSLNLINNIASNLNDSLISDNLLSKSLIDSLSIWSQELRHSQTNLFSLDDLKEKFPSCWPSEYQNSDHISVSRNKLFESFEKSKSKNNNFSGNSEILSNLKDSQSFPICIFKNNVFNFKNHPLQGRSIITGLDVPIVFKTVGKSVNGVFPIISKNHSVKYSNNQYTNNPISLSNNQKIQGIISSGQANSLEFIPATRSDWDMPFVDLSNSLFTSNSVSYKVYRYSDAWNMCSSSYSKILSEENRQLFVPSYLNEENQDLNAISSKFMPDKFNEQTNVDILDLFPIFSWLENPNNSNPVDPKVSFSNLLIQANKTSKKCNSSKNSTRVRARHLDQDQAESLNKLRRSTRNASKLQNSEKIDTESSLLSNKVDSNSIDINGYSFQLINELKNGESNLSNTSKNVAEKIDDINKVDSIKREFMNTCLGEENSTNDNLKEITCVDTDIKKLNHEDQLETNHSEIENRLNRAIDDSELHALNESNNCSGESINVQTQSLSADEELPVIDLGTDSKKLLEDDEFNCPLLGHKRKNKFLLEYDENNSIKAEEVNHELYEEGNRTGKKRLRKKSSVLSLISDMVNTDNIVEACNSEFNPKISESVSIKWQDIDEGKVESNTSSQTLSNTIDKSLLQTIPRKKPLDTTTSVAVSPKSDPWIPKSDSISNRRDGQLDEFSQPFTQKVRNHSWQIDQKRQRPVDQRRPVQSSASCHRNYYYQNKHRVLTGYESHNKHYSRHRNNQNSEFVNHHSTSFFNNSHYYSQNVSSSSQSLQHIPANESNYDYQGYKGYLNPKYSSSSSSNATGSINRHYRGR